MTFDSVKSFFSSSKWLGVLCIGLPAVSAGVVYVVMLRRRCSNWGETELPTQCAHVEDHPRDLIPQICREFHHKGWMTGSGGAISIKHGKEIYVSPSGVLKEKVGPSSLFVCDIDGNHVDGPPASTKLKKSSCAPMFMNAYQRRGAGAVFHIHSQNAIMVTMLFPGKEFRISHQQMIKAIVNWKTGKYYRYDEELILPIVENQNLEIEIKDVIVAAMEEYPEASAVLVRRHGIYLWGRDWVEAKLMCESFDFIFEVVVKMISNGMDPSKKPGSAI